MRWIEEGRLAGGCLVIGLLLGPLTCSLGQRPVAAKPGSARGGAAGAAVCRGDRRRPWGRRRRSTPVGSSAGKRPGAIAVGAAALDVEGARHCVVTTRESDNAITRIEPRRDGEPCGGGGLHHPACHHQRQRSSSLHRIADAYSRHPLSPLGDCPGRLCRAEFAALLGVRFGHDPCARSP